MTELAHDSVATIRTRIEYHAIARRVRAVAPPRSFVVAEYPDLVSGALEDDIVIAQPSRDDFADTARILAAAGANGRAAFVVLTPRSLERIGADVSAPLASARGVTIRRVETADPR